MVERLHETLTKIAQIGNSKGVRIPKTYREIAGIENKGSEIVVALLTGKHGPHIGIWKKGEQPDIPESQIKKKLQKESPGHGGNRTEK